MKWGNLRPELTFLDAAFGIPEGFALPVLSGAVGPVLAAEGRPMAFESSSSLVVVFVSTACP